MEVPAVASSSSSSTHPDVGVNALMGKRSKLDVYV